MTIYFGDGSEQPTSGKILQVVQTVKTDTFSGTANGSELTLTGMTADITPKVNTSKVMVIASLFYCANGTTYGFYIKRESTIVGIGAASSSRQRMTGALGLTGDANQCDQYTIHFLDSTATTSETTYSLYANNDNNVALYLNRSINDTDSNVGKRGISTLTLYEIEV